MTDIHDLQRFVHAQDFVYARVRAELAAGRKTSHWMWFIFPQMRGLGSSPMAQRFAIGSRAEAVAYAAHPVLGARLRECAGLVHGQEGLTAHQIFGTPDDMKLRSSMTLFARVVADEPIFAAILAKYFGGDADPATLARLPS